MHVVYNHRRVCSLGKQLRPLSKHGQFANSNLDKEKSKLLCTCFSEVQNTGYNHASCILEPLNCHTQQ
jgi:hypothetical protein